MKAKKMQRLVGGYLESITRAAASVDDGFDEGIIHDLRVNVKRLRALLRMYWLFAGEARPDIPKSLKKAYKTAGEIRDLQLLLKNVAGGGKLPEVYRREIEVQLETAKGAWKEVYDARKLKRARKKLEAFAYRPIPSFIPAEFVKDRLALIDELRAADKEDDEDLHTVRKRVKDIVYLLRLVHDSWGKARTAMQHMPFAKFEELADVIGAFNDTWQMKARLSALDVREAAKRDVTARSRFVSQVGQRIAAQREAAESCLSELDGSKFF